MALPWKLLLVAAISVLHVTSARDIKLVAVVDAEMQQMYGSSLGHGVAYLNRPGSAMLAGNDVTLDIISSMDNDSIGAMDKVCDKLAGGVDVIIDLSTRYVTATMRSLAEAMGIPHVASVDASVYEWNVNREYKTSVNLEPPSSILLQSIRDIVSQENLTNVGIIYDETFNLDNKPKRLLRNIPAQHLYLRMASTPEAIYDQLQKIKSAELHYLFLACSSDNADAFIGKAQEEGMMTFKYSWYVLTMDSQLVCDRCVGSATVIVMTGKTSFAPMGTYVEFMNQRYQETGSGVKFNRNDIEMMSAFHFDLVNLVGRALQARLSSDNWLAMNYTDCFSFTETDPAALAQAEGFKTQLKGTTYQGVFGNLRWEGDTARQDLSLDIHRITYEKGSSVNDIAIGNWSLNDHIYAFNGTITNKNVKKSYRIITIEEPPFVFKSLEPPPVEKEVAYYYFDALTGYYYYGYCIDLIYNINKTGTMQFDFVLLEPQDHAYGTMQEDGSWNGMINELIDDRADIAVAPLSVMAERENVIDFTVPYYDLVGITILMKKPEFEYTVFRFMSVLEDPVWGCIFSAFIIVSVLLAVFDKFSPYSYQNNKESWDGQGEEPRIFTLKEGLWFCMTSLTPQGGGEAPRALSGRLVAATWWMFGFIMIATYTANLAAFLTVSRLDQPIESLDDLAKQFKTKYAPQVSTSTEIYFRRMADIEEKFYTIWKAMSLNDSLDQVERAKLAVWDYPVSDKFTNMWVSMTESGFPKTFTEAIERIKSASSEEEEFAFIGDATQNKYATLTDCDLWEVGEEFSRKPYALAVQEGSPLRSELSSVILQLLNQRVLEDLKTYWWDFDRKTCPKIEDESDGITIYNIGGVFLVIFIGIGLGLLTLAFEYYWYRWRPSAKGDKGGQGAADGSTDGAHSRNGTGSGFDNGGEKYAGHDNSAFDRRT